MKKFLIRNLKNISFCCLIFVMAAIFFFSSQSAQESSELSGKIVTAVIKIFIPSYDKLPFFEQQIIQEKISYVVRKTAHFTEFTALGFFLILYLFSLNLNIKLFYLTFFSWLGGTFYAVIDEIHQMFVKARYSSVTDVLIDSSGVLFGIIILSFLLKLYNKKELQEYSI